MATSRTGMILVVDDEEIMREILETLLSREGYEVRLAASAAEGLEHARSVPFDAAIVDMMMPGMDGISALDELKKIDDDLPVLMITAFASVENAIAAMKRGAFDYISKPFKNDEVLAVLRNALAQRRLVAENRALRQNLQAHANRFGDIIGKSVRMRQVFDLIIQAAPSRTTILINGESGTGKELVARSLHQNSSRADRAFITVNSGSLPPDLLESNLFGHVKGAFTGALYPKKGLFELADLPELHPASQTAAATAPVRTRRGLMGSRAFRLHLYTSAVLSVFLLVLYWAVNLVAPDSPFWPIFLFGSPLPSGPGGQLSEMKVFHE